MSAAVLQEYVVALGFNIDEVTQRRFRESLRTVLLEVAALATGFEGLRGMAREVLHEIPKAFETLFYVSQQTGDSVKNLEALEYGFRQIGLSAQQATGLATSFGNLMKNPGFAGYLTQMGVPDGTATERLTGFIKLLNSQNIMTAKGMGEAFGIPFDMLQRLMNNKDVLEKSVVDFKQRQKAAGVDPEQLAKDSVEFERSFNKLRSNFQILAELLAGPVIKALTGMAEWLNDHFGFALGTPSVDTPVGGGAGDVPPSKKHSWIEDWFRDKFGTPPQTGSVKIPSSKSMSTILDAFNYFQSEGMTAQGSAGSIANLWQESKLNHRSKISDSDGKIHFGIGQWGPDRTAELGKFAGKDPFTTSFAEQLAFFVYEMKQGNDAGARKAWKYVSDPSVSAFDAAGAVSKYDERPRDTNIEMKRRGAYAEAFLSDFLRIKKDSLVFDDFMPSNNRGIGDVDADYAGKVLAKGLFGNDNLYDYAGRGASVQDRSSLTFSPTNSVVINGVGQSHTELINEVSRAMMRTSGDQLRYLQNNAQ